MESGLKRILWRDPWLALPRADEQLTEAERGGRDRAWAIIERILAAGPDEVFDRRARGRLVARVVEAGLATKPTFYRLLHRYWRGGQTVHALIPRYGNSGGSGKARLASVSAEGKKRGRPSLAQVYTGEPYGINVDEGVRRLLVRIGEEFYENRKGLTKRRAYEEGLKKYFSEGYDLLPEGLPVPILPPPERLPTFNQFEYWYGKARDPKRVAISREGQKEYDLKRRGLRGDSTSMAFGPGSVYQIDATIGDVYLVSSRDPRLVIGRPVIYVVVDTFSRLVVGFTVGLEGPSWMGAVLAFENVAADKVEFCASLGIRVGPNDWPSQHLPEAVLAYRGELEGESADSLVRCFGVRVANTPPYRPDWKAVVERHFRLVNDRIVSWLPGAVRRNMRGDRDHRLDAALTLAQLRKVLALCFLEHNQNNLIGDYPLQADMRRDGVRPYPLTLWRWGIENRTGGLRYSAPEAVRSQILPRAKATMEPRGLCYKRRRYTCELIEVEDWRARARQRGTWKVRIAYDPWSSGRVWMEVEGRRDLVPCDEIPDVVAGDGVPWAELDLEAALDKLHSRLEQGVSRQARVGFDAQIDQVLREAKDRTDSVFPAASRAERLRNITANRRDEKRKERDQSTRGPTRNTRGSAITPGASSIDVGIPLFDPSVASDLDSLVRDRQED